MTRAQIPLTYLIAMGLILSQSGCRRAGPIEGCNSLDVAALGLKRVSAGDWQQIDRRAMQQHWPGSLGAESEAVDGIEAVGMEALKEEIARCLEQCELCGGAAMDREGPQGRLRMIELWSRLRPLESQRAALDALTQAAIGSDRKIERTSASRSDERIIEGYSWIANGELFTLQTDAIKTDDDWLGNFQLGRCRSEVIIDTWRTDSEGTVRIARADFENEGDRRVLWFGYVTLCVLADESCRASELDQLWPTLRAFAERQKATKIRIAAETCVGSSVTVSVDRGPDRQWTGGIWRPKPN